MRHGYQLETSPLGDNPVLHRLKDDTSLSMGHSQIRLLQLKRLIMQTLACLGLRFPLAQFVHKPSTNDRVQSEMQRHVAGC